MSNSSAINYGPELNGFVSVETKEGLNSVKICPTCMGNYCPLFVNGQSKIIPSSGTYELTITWPGNLLLG